jgi:hypothetical protein
MFLARSYTPACGDCPSLRAYLQSKLYLFCDFLNKGHCLSFVIPIRISDVKRNTKGSLRSPSTLLAAAPDDLHMSIVIQP